MENMLDWAYDIPSWMMALRIVFFFEVASLGGLYLARRFILPRLRLHDGVNDAVGGTISAIGVFYGITVGLIAVGVWNTYANASALATQEAAAIGALYRDVSSYPDPARGELQAQLKDYTMAVIEKDWPAHHSGQIPADGTRLLTEFQTRLTSFEPATIGQQVLHAETLRAFNELAQDRRMRLDAVNGALSNVMWFVIWIGAAINIVAGYFFYFQDARLHAVMVGLMAGFLAIVVFLIVANDRPFMGDTAVTPSAYQLVLDTLISPR
jgi:hypothetical protein